jgi:hypothetical protein
VRLLVSGLDAFWRHERAILSPDPPPVVDSTDVAEIVRHDHPLAADLTGNAPGRGRGRPQAVKATEGCQAKGGPGLATVQAGPLPRRRG